jgi:hypothetical protein
VSICVITPRLPPAMDGLADYCYQMFMHWPNDKPPNNFLVLDSESASKAFWTQASIGRFEANKESLLNSLNASAANTVFLQYVGYGYDANGAPLWLAAALKEWLTSKQERRLVTMFHETWSSGSFWQKTFWYMAKQKQCVKEIMLLSSAMGTSCQVNKDSLDLLGTRKDVRIIPLGSSFQISQAKSKDWQQLLVFGKEYARLRGLKTHKALLAHLIESKTIERIVLAGQLNSSGNDQSLKLVQELPSIEVITSYNFKSTDVPDPVMESGLALMHTQSTHMLKSTSFHLAAKLGQICLVEDSGAADAPFIDGQHYLSYKNPQQISTALHDKTKLESISSEILKVADTYLSWPSIAANWAQLLNS